MEEKSLFIDQTGNETLPAEAEYAAKVFLWLHLSLSLLKSLRRHISSFS